MRPTLKEIFDVTLLELNISREAYERAGRSREARMVKARRIMCYMGRHFGYTLHEVADYLKMNHATVHYHAEGTKDAIYYEKGYSYAVNNILSHFDFVQRVSTTNGWLARDEDGSLNFFNDRPTPCEGVWVARTNMKSVPRDQFPQVTYIDSPLPCEMTLRLK